MSQEFDIKPNIISDYDILDMNLYIVGLEEMVKAMEEIIPRMGLEMAKKVRTQMLIAKVYIANISKSINQFPVLNMNADQCQVYFHSAMQKVIQETKEATGYDPTNVKLVPFIYAERKDKKDDKH